MIQIGRCGRAPLTTADSERQIAYSTDIVALAVVERSKDRVCPNR